MEVKALAVVVLAYMSFVFFSRRLNPWSKPISHSDRRRWRFGRRMAVGFFLAGVVVLSLRSMVRIDIVSSAIAFAIIVSCFWAIFSRKSPD